MKKILIFFLVAMIFVPQAGAIYQYDPQADATYKTGVIETEHFWIEFSVDDFYAHNVVPDKNQNNIHDALDETMELLEEVWEVEMAMGFEMPTGSEEEGKILVILDEDYDYISEDLLGFTGIDSDLKPYIVLDFNLLLSGEEQDEDDFKMTVAHEFFHAIQFGYDPYFWAYYSDLNFSEGSATAVAEYVFEDLSLSANYSPIYFYSYGESLYGASYDYAFPYGTYLWTKFLMANYGEEILVEIFETYFEIASSGDYIIDMYLATDAALQNYANVQIHEAFREFTVWNFDIGKYDDETLNHGIQDYWFTEEIWEYPAYESSNAYVSPLGASYVRFDPSDVEENLKITVYGQSDAKWMVTILTQKYHRFADVYDSRIVYQNEGEVSFVVEDASKYSDVVMILSPIPSTYYSGADFDQYYTYSYYATDEGGSEPADSVVLEDGEIQVELFSDFSSEDEYFFPVKVLKSRGVIEGYKNSTFQVGRPVSRAEVVKMIVVALAGADDYQGYVNCFNDVYEGWYEKYVCYAEEQGWVEGYEDGKFRPLDAVSKVEAVAMMLDAFDIAGDWSLEIGDSRTIFSDVEDGAWYEDYLGKGYDWGLFDEKKGYKFGPDASLSRGAFSDMLYRLLQVEKVIDAVDGEGFSSDVWDYFVFDEGEEFRYVVYEDGDRVGTEVVKNVGDCEGHTICIAQESTDGRMYYYYSDDEVRLYREVRDGGEIDYSDPLLVLSEEDAVEYSAVSEGVLLFGGSEMEIIDVVAATDVSYVPYVWADSVKYEDLLKVSSEQVANFKLVSGQEAYYGEMLLLVDSYWAEGIGMVKRLSSGEIEFMGDVSEIEEGVWELVGSG